MNTDKNLTIGWSNNAATSTVWQQWTEGFIPAAHRCLYATNSMHKKCLYTFLHVLLTFQPSRAWSDVICKGCKQHNCFVCFCPCFLLPSPQHLHWRDITRCKYTHSCNSSITNCKNNHKAVKLPERARRGKHHVPDNRTTPETTAIILKQMQNLLAIKSTCESILLVQFPVPMSAKKGLNCAIKTVPGKINTCKECKCYFNN